ncbi:MAG: hypothetical protein ACXAE3_12960, partial [Candidatus Kariarchaeaceae archaeon]
NCSNLATVMEDLAEKIFRQIENQSGFQMVQVRFVEIETNLFGLAGKLSSVRLANFNFTSQGKH